MSAMSGIMDRIDGLQQRRAMFGFPYAVIKRYTRTTEPGRLARRHHAFFSLNPLIVVFVTLATWLLNDRPDLLRRVLEAMGQVSLRRRRPDAGRDRAVRRWARGNSWILALSLLVTLWGGLGLARVLQDGVDTIGCRRLPTAAIAASARPFALDRRSPRRRTSEPRSSPASRSRPTCRWAASCSQQGEHRLSWCRRGGVSATIATTVELRQLLPGAAMIAGAHTSSPSSAATSTTSSPA